MQPTNYYIDTANFQRNNSQKRWKAKTLGRYEVDVILAGHLLGTALENIFGGLDITMDLNQYSHNTTTTPMQVFALVGKIGTTTLQATGLTLRLTAILEMRANDEFDVTITLPTTTSNSSTKFRIEPKRLRVRARKVPV